MNMNNGHEKEETKDKVLGDQWDLDIKIWL